MSAPHRLRRVDPTARRGLVYKLYVRLASSRFATWLATKAIWSATIWRIDPHLMRWTRGRLGTGLLLPTALLETRGARTGQLRRNAVIYFHDGDRVTVIASQAGRPGNPSWFYNARANPDVELGGHRFRAEPVEDEGERTRLWVLADRIFPAFATYRRSAGRAGRTIPIMRLVPRGGPAHRLLTPAGGSDGAQTAQDPDALEPCDRSQIEAVKLLFDLAPFPELTWLALLALLAPAEGPAPPHPTRA